MRYWMFICALALPIHAFAWVKVTNLSGQPQSVTVSHAGTDTTREIPPNMTQYFHNSEGMMALNGAAAIAKAQRAPAGPAGKIFGDIVASNRTSGIPLRNGNRYVIWPDGRLLLQNYRTNLDGF